ncbi:transposase [Corynebacterium belfantii]|uniref:transposase n=1 Tax=Corynebacterium belfantii TaxID=2014537 RepID=UPI0035A89F5F
MYLATVIDLYSRKLAGFAIADHMRSSLVIEALDHTNTARGGLDGAIFHSDHSSVYTSAAFSTRCQELGVIQSMGAIGTSADNEMPRVFFLGVYLVFIIADSFCCCQYSFSTSTGVR